MKKNDIDYKFIRITINKVSELLREFTENEKKEIELKSKNHDTFIEQIAGLIHLILSTGKTLIVDKEEQEKLLIELALKRNQKGKTWRQGLIKLAKIEYENNRDINKTQALKIAFNKLPDDKKDKNDFDNHFKSILDTLYKS